MARQRKAGEDINGYEVIRMISSGNIAICYEAIDRQDRSRHVFLKEYKSPTSTVDWCHGYIAYQSRLFQRFRTTPELAERTYGFVEVFENKKVFPGGKVMSSFCQVFDYLDGGNELKCWLATKDSPGGQKLSRERAYVFAMLILHSVALLHENGIVHTDLKPENVYLVPSQAEMGYNLKIIDFDFTVQENVAVPWDGKAPYVGTPRYMSPEHLRNEKPERASDVFTVAIMLYELLSTNGHPFPDESEYERLVFADDPPAPVFAVRDSEDVSAFAQLLQQALSADPANRPTCRELHAELGKLRKVFLEEPPPLLLPPPTPPSLPPAASLGRIGLRSVVTGNIVWIETGKTIGRNSGLEALELELSEYSVLQYMLMIRKGHWEILPGKKVKRLTLLNHKPLTKSARLEEGDIISVQTDTGEAGILEVVIDAEDGGTASEVDDIPF